MRIVLYIELPKSHTLDLWANHLHTSLNSTWGRSWFPTAQFVFLSTAQITFFFFFYLVLCMHCWKSFNTTMLARLIGIVVLYLHWMWSQLLLWSRLVNNCFCWHSEEHNSLLRVVAHIASEDISIKLRCSQPLLRGAAGCLFILM